MKVLLWIALALAACVIALGITLIALPDAYIRSLAIKVVAAQTGRQLQIGTLTLERGLSTRLTLTEISLQNADWASDQPMLQVDRLAASLELPRLLRGQVHLPTVESSGLRLSLERSESGQANWQLSAEPRATNLGFLSIANVILNDTKVIHDDRSAQRRNIVTLDQAVLSAPENEPLSLDITGNIDQLPVKASLTTDPIPHGGDLASDTSVRNVRLRARAGELDLYLTGQLDPDSDTLPLNADVRIRVDSLADIGDMIDRPLPPIGPIELSSNIALDPAQVTDKGVDLQDLRFQVNDELLSLALDGQLQNLLDSNEVALELWLELSDAEQALELLGIKRRLPGQLTAEASLTGSNGLYDVALTSAEFASEFVNARLSGSVLDVLNAADASINVGTTLPDLSIVTQLFGVNMPPEWGPISATGVLEGKDGDYAMNELDATLDGRSKARASGRIERLVPFNGMHLNTEANLSTLAEISAFTPRPLPELGPMIGTGKVHWQDGYLSLSEARATHSSKVGIATVTGEIGDLIHFDQVRLRADADLPDFSVLSLFTGIEFPRVDHVVASANLVSVDALDLSARQLKVSATRDEVTINGSGSVDSFFKQGAVLDLDLASNVESLASLDSLLGVELPNIGPVNASARLTGAKRDIALGDIRASLSDESLSSTIRPADPTPLRIASLALDDIAVDVELSTASLSQAARKLGVSSTINQPAQASSRLQLDKEGSLRFSDTTLTLGDNQLLGNVTLRHFDDPQQRTAVEGDITVQRLDLLELFDAPVGLKQSSPDPESDKADSTGRVLSDSPIALELIGDVDAKLDIDIRQFRSALFDISDASLAVDLSRGVMVAGPFTGVVNEGQASLDLVIDSTTSPPSVVIELALDEIDLSRAGLLGGSDLIENAGGAWGRLSMTGRGHSVAQILATANGEGGLYVENLLIKENALSLFSSDLLDQLVDALNPLDKRPEQTRLRCSAMTFELENGELRTPFGLAVEADDFVIVGDAEIGFGQEQLEIEFDTRAKRGLGIGLNRITNLVKLDGSFASPSLSLSGSGLLKFGASLAAAIASSGGTLIAEGLYEKSRANVGVCTRALGQQN